MADIDRKQQEADLKRIMLKTERLSTNEASMLLEEVLSTLVEVRKSTGENLYKAEDKLFKFRDLWFNLQKEVHSNASEGEVGPTGIPGELGPSGCPKGVGFPESILEKPIVFKDTYKHELPYFLMDKTQTVCFNINANCNKVVILYVDENNKVFSDIDINLPKGNKVLNMSLGDKE